MPFIIFVVSRLLLFLGAFIAQKTVPYLGFFPYKELLVEYHLPSWISACANFDGIHYLLIAKQGYSQWEQAFFPLYPLLIKALTFVIPNSLVAALFISNTSFAIGLIFFQKLLKRWGLQTNTLILFLLAFPTAFFFGIIYTESLFFMLFILSLYFLYKKKYWLAGICAAFSSATRLIGIFLIIPFFFHFITDYKGTLKSFNISALRFKPVLFSPLLGLFSYMFYLWRTTGDPLFFFNSQPLFGANRSTHLIFLPQVYYRYLKILFTASHNFQWYLSFFEVGIFSVVFIVLILDLVKIVMNISSFRPASGGEKSSERSERKNSNASLDFSITSFFRNDRDVMNRLGLNIFSLINIILPTLTGTFSSIPRYTLFSFSFFLYLAQLKSRGIKIGIFVAFVTLQIILFSLFIQGYFVG